LIGLKCIGCPKAISDSAASKLDSLAAFLDHLPVAAAIKDLAGRYLWTNQFASRNIAKKKLADLVGKTTGEVFHVSGTKGIEEQADIVKTQKIGLVALVMINAEHSRPGLRFPLLDTQGRVTRLGSIGTVGPPVAIQHK
jgi:PAS fold